MCGAYGAFSVVAGVWGGEDEEGGEGQDGCEDVDMKMHDGR